jgi:hypothetical protein
MHDKYVNTYSVCVHARMQHGQYLIEIMILAALNQMKDTHKIGPNYFSWKFFQ